LRDRTRANASAVLLDPASAGALFSAREARATVDAVAGSQLTPPGP
jgi:hypothetical protein